jgi:hypothetical protein
MPCMSFPIIKISRKRIKQLVTLSKATTSQLIHTSSKIRTWFVFFFFLAHKEAKLYFRGKAKYKAPNQLRQEQGPRQDQDDQEPNTSPNTRGPIFDPPNLQILPGADGRSQPHGVKPNQSRPNRGRILLNFKLNFLPRASPIVAQTLPNNFLDLLMTPPDIIEASVVPGDPNSPKRNTFQQRPIPTNLLKLARRSLSKDSLLPVRHIPRHIRSRGSQMFQKTVDRVPDLLRSITLPKSV